MNKTHRIKVLGLLGLPLLAVALAVMVFTWGSHTADTAEAVTSGAALSMTVSPTQACPGAKASGDVCVAAGSAFTVTVNADAVPLPSGYVGAQAFIQYGATGLTYKSAVIGDWANDPVPASNAVFVCSDNGTGVGCGAATGLIAPPATFFKGGSLFVFTFNCTTAKSQGHVLDLETLGGANAGTSGGGYKPFPNGTAAVAATGNTINLNCTNPNTPTPTFTPTATPTDTPTATPPDFPKMQKLPALQNVFLTRQGSKIPPSDCNSGTNVGGLSEQLNLVPVTFNPKGDAQTNPAAFEFEVHYDATKVCVDLTTGGSWTTAGAICIIEDSVSKPQLEGVARIGCVTVGKGLGINALDPLAQIDVGPQPDVYSQAKPNQDNGVVVQINNVGCDLSDEQGHAIALFSCDDADITYRYLEGDVEPDCVIDAVDAQSIAFRWGASKGSTIYRDFMNLEPSGTQADNDIDINDLQFVFGRFGSDCTNPHPPQPPVNPKA